MKNCRFLTNRLYMLEINPHYHLSDLPDVNQPSGQSLFSVPRMLGCFFFCTARFESNTSVRCFCSVKMHQGHQGQSIIQSTNFINKKQVTSEMIFKHLHKLFIVLVLNTHFKKKTPWCFPPKFSASWGTSPLWKTFCAKV